MLGQHGLQVQSRANVGDVNDEDDEPGGLDPQLQQLDEVGVGIDDGSNRQLGQAIPLPPRFQELCPSAAYSSATVFPVTGSIQSGAISRSGSSTNRRSR